ncbi:MAG: efflux RND transporter periplasmic adaptor subunit [Burkholderiales bacterium]|nr:efflux RND transporter periplasmic adaptor subunit [Burkholderiales bacterium]
MPAVHLPPTPARPARLVLLPLALIAALLAGCSRESAAPPAPSGPPEVGVVTLQPVRQSFTTELSGRTTAYLSADIRPQVGGIVKTRNFTEGATVRPGQVLYQLDPAPAEATLASAEAALARARASAAAAQTTAARNAELVKIDAVSQQVNDTAQAALAQARADVAVAEALVQTARINVGYTRITSPIAGRVSTSTVTPGALVTANQATALTTVQQIDPIYVDVTQSSAEVLRLKRELAAGRLTRSGGAESARMRILLEDGTPYGREGRLQFAGLSVNQSTGAITLRGTVANPDGLLLPGMYVRAVIEEGVDEQALLVPQQGVTRDATGRATALVVGADGVVVRRNVTLGRAVGNRWLVREGLAAGDRVIVEGMQRARAGQPARAVAVQVPEAPTGAARAGAAAGTPAPAASAPVAPASAAGN